MTDITVTDTPHGLHLDTDGGTPVTLSPDAVTAIVQHELVKLGLWWAEEQRALVATTPDEDGDFIVLELDDLDAVLAQHRPVSYAATANCGLVLYEVCPTCHDKAGVHPCGCWRDEDQIHVCAECNKVWPCATAEAIETALAGGCSECRQVDSHHKLDCGRRTS